MFPTIPVRLFTVCTCPFDKHYSYSLALEQVNRKIFVRGLPWETTDSSLRSVFEPFGEIIEVCIHIACTCCLAAFVSGRPRVSECSQNG